MVRGGGVGGNVCGGACRNVVDAVIIGDLEAVAWSVIIFAVIGVAVAVVKGTPGNIRVVFRRQGIVGRVVESFWMIGCLSAFSLVFVFGRTKQLPFVTLLIVTSRLVWQRHDVRFDGLQNQRIAFPDFF